ncbi:glycosyltransferase [Candidatus Dojkabacteria bacterium]|uniref:Glycosyltransferase n=1 Tax=Candidatus Dojkabacteria bacterium TaxID=2099670 RepID=A0A3M0Z0A5_9BACT|nr:MAG: glycosyltransferase [Candidatus Dojkabacteria bacterium]
MTVSVVIPTLNEERYLPFVLESIRSSRFTILQKHQIEVIIADAKSTDNTVEIASQYGVKVIDGGIPSVGRNKGASISNGEIMIFLDADVIFSDSFLENCILELINRKLDVAGAYFSVTRGSMQYIFFVLLNNIAKFVRQFTPYPVVHGDFIICRKEVFENLGGFDEKMFFGEDNDFVLRSVKSKFKYRVLKQSYITSERRIQKIGIWGITKTFLIFTFEMLRANIKNLEVQERLRKVYGENLQSKHRYTNPK